MFETIFPDFFQIIALGVIGIVFLIFTADYVVRKLLLIADHYGLSDSFVGLTVLSIGTSLPEISSHLVASIAILWGAIDYKVASATVLGANIGSDVVQQTLVLGIVVFIVGTITFSKEFLIRSYPAMVGTTILTLILGWDGTLSQMDGFILLGTFVVYLIYLYRDENGSKRKKPIRIKNVGKEVLLTLAGLVVLFLTSLLVLKVSEYLVFTTGLGGSLIGVVSLGIAAALPEMFAAIIGMKRGASGLSLGTLIGSNITNPLLAIGLGAAVSGYYVPKPLVYWDLPVEAITALLLLVWIFFTKRKLGIWGGVYLALLYAVYIVVRLLFFAVD